MRASLRSSRWYRSMCLASVMPAGHVCPPQPEVRSSWTLSGAGIRPPKSSAVSPAGLYSGSGVRSWSKARGLKSPSGDGDLDVDAIARQVLTVQPLQQAGVIGERGTRQQYASLSSTSNARAACACRVSIPGTFICGVLSCRRHDASQKEACSLPRFPAVQVPADAGQPWPEAAVIAAIVDWRLVLPSAAPACTCRSTAGCLGTMVPR